MKELDDAVIKFLEAEKAENESFLNAHSKSNPELYEDHNSHQLWIDGRLK